MIAVIRESLPDGDTTYTGLVQVSAHGDAPVLVGARCLNGRPRHDALAAIHDARRHAGASKDHFPSIRSDIALQRSQPPGRTVYSGLVKVGRVGRVPVFVRAAAPEFHWPEDPDEAVARAKEGVVAEA